MAYAKKTVRLTKEQKNYLHEFIAKKDTSYQAIKRANILLEATISDGEKPKRELDIAQKLGVSSSTVKSVKKLFHDSGQDIKAVINRKQRKEGPREKKITDDVEFYLITLCYSPAPDGYTRWTVRLLAEYMEDLGYIDYISPMSVSRILRSAHVRLT